MVAENQTTETKNSTTHTGGEPYGTGNFDQGNFEQGNFEQEHSGTRGEAHAHSQTANPGSSFGEETPGAKPDAATGESGDTRRMLYRHPTDTVIGGVCGGLADYFGWDASLVRILWVILTLATSGGGLLAYAALWIVLPVGTAAEGRQRAAQLELNERNLTTAAWILIGLGGVWLLGNIGVLPWLWGSLWRAVSILFWPLLLVGVGLIPLQYIGKNKGWKLGMSNSADSVRTSMGERMPNKASLKSGFDRFRQGFPLKRSSNDRIWMGVCGGIGNRLGIDSNLVRLIWAAFSVGSIGMGVLIYILAGLFLVYDKPVGTLLDNGELADDEAHEVQIIDAPSNRNG